MSRTRLLFLLAALLAVAWMVFVLARPWVGRPAAAGGVGSHETAEPSAADPTGAVPPRDGATGTRAPVAELPAVVRERVESAEAVVHGRCVDEGGAPLAGVTVAVQGWPTNDDRMARHLLDHPMVEWTDPAGVVTGVDGRFRLAFDPPPPFQFVVTAKADGRAVVSARWSEIASDARIDLGDVAIPRGAMVSGQVLDAGGLPVTGIGVLLAAAGDAGVRSTYGSPQVRDHGRGRTDARGRFALRDPLPPGTYVVRADGGLEVKEPSAPVRVDLPLADLRVVVISVADESPSVSGMVVDARGAPIAGARIWPGTAWYDDASSGSDGTFSLRQSDRSPRGPVRLSAAADGFVAWTAAEPVEWGTAGVHIVLSEGPPLTIRVRRADGGAPVERFGIVLAPVRPPGSHSSSDHELRHLGDHPDGVLRIPRASTGRFRLSVVPAESSGLAAGVDEEIEIEEGVPEFVDVSLGPIRDRVVVVEDSDGRPVPGVRVELLEAMAGGEIRMDTVAFAPDRARLNDPRRIAILRDERVTGADGTARIRGPGDRDYGLRLPGPGHLPVFVHPFRMDEDVPVRVVVQSGATIRGRLDPASLVAALREEAGLPPAGPVDDAHVRLLPSLSLTGTGRRHGERLPVGRGIVGVPIGDDGSFVFAGIPAGTWDVHLSRSSLLDGSGVTSTSRARVMSDLTLTDGEVREVVIDLSTWRRVPVEVTVRVDGEPFAGVVWLHGEGEALGVQRFVRTDAAGTGRTSLPAGDWRAQVSMPIGASNVPLTRSGLTVDRADATTAFVLDFRTASCTWALSDLRGEPVRQVAVLARTDGARSTTYTARTDDTGRATIHGTPGLVQVRVRRAPVKEDAAYSVWAADKSPQQQERAWIELGSFDLVPGGGVTHSIRLPAEWESLPQ